MIHDEIRSLLDSPPAGAEAPTIDDIEHTLTAGYARALALEAERWRLERRMSELTGELHNGDRELKAKELAQLSSRLSCNESVLSGLRGTLAKLRARTTAVRALG